MHAVAPAVPGPEVAPDLVAVVVPAASRADPEAGVAVNQREEAPRRPNLVIAATLDRGRGAPVDLGLKGLFLLVQILSVFYWSKVNKPTVCM